MGWGWGAQRIASAPVELPGALPIVRVADSGLGQAEKWQNRPDQEWRVLQRYLEASGAPSDDNADSIVIWPEGAIPVDQFLYARNPNFMSALGQGLGDRVLITGLTRREMQTDGVAYFNSAAVIDGVNGAPRVSQTYDKNHLVPFGEYIPFWNLVSNLNIAPFAAHRLRLRSRSHRRRVWSCRVRQRLIVLICYEAIFPGMTPHGDERPGWIVMVTNDAWFGGGSGPYQHYAMARYRAIEEGLPVARAASGEFRLSSMATAARDCAT
jgi:apolipoprotein N-acyltransferase